MKPTPRGHVYLVDDNADIRFYLSDLLRQKGYVIESFDSAQAFLQHPMDLFPAVLLLDVRMPHMTGVELQDQLKALGRMTPIVFISGESHTDEIIQAMKGHPIEFLWKPFLLPDLIGAIDQGLAIDAQNRQAWMVQNDIRLKWQTLSARERDVLALMLEGHTNKGISQRLDILPDTAKKYRAHVLQKMQTPDLADLMALCKGVDVRALDP